MSMISELVDRLRRESKSMGKYGTDYMATLLMQAADTIAMLSEKAKVSADRPQGEWIKHDEERDYCSRCKRIFTTRTITKQDKWTTYVADLGYNFCPNCGAKMKGADDE